VSNRQFASVITVLMFLMAIMTLLSRVLPRELLITPTNVNYVAPATWTLEPVPTGPIRPDVPCIEVTAPAATVENSKNRFITRVDVLFVLDTTSSMNPYIQGVKNSIQAFAAEFKLRKADARLGLIAFRDRTAGEESQMLMFANQQFTSDPDCFSNAVGKLQGAGGGYDIPESQLDALIMAAQQPFRSDANRKVLVLITDAPPKLPDQTTRTYEQVSDAIRKHKINFFYLIINDHDKSIYQSLATMSGVPGGTLSLIDAASGKIDFERVLPEIARNVSKY
jgi:Ca-activated chloride channel family protein